VRASILSVLLAEKVLQHAVVTWALVTDQFGLRQVVAVDYRWLALAGAIAGVLFGGALAGLLRGRPWSLPLAIGLAAFDIAGEFVAQGRLGISVTVSFVVAIAILVLAWGELRRTRPD
jgi:hypothetical protein